MALPFDVCIRGDGVVGRTLALLLARDRLRVGLVGAVAPAGGDHHDLRAYALNAHSRVLLQALRAWPADALATPVQAMRIHGDEGGEVLFDAAQQGVPALAWIVDARALLDALGQALRYQAQIELLQTPVQAPLTVVCEGRASATRAEFGVLYETTAYAQQAIAARLRSEHPHGQAARQWFGQGDILALLPTGQTLDGAASGNSLALVWSVPQDQVASLLALPATEFEARVQVASHHALGALTLDSERRAWPLQLARAARWCGNGWALAGDAAHAVHPLAGQGLNLGLADARALAQVLHEREPWRAVGDGRLLRRYERARKAAVLTMGATTDGLQQLFARDGGPWPLLRNWGMSGFDRAQPLKHWVARRAMGLR